MCRDRLWIRHQQTPAILPIYIDFRLELVFLFVTWLFFYTT